MGFLHGRRFTARTRSNVDPPSPNHLPQPKATCNQPLYRRDTPRQTLPPRQPEACHDVSLGDVAFQTGFSSAAYFVAAFRQRLGVAPGVLKEAVLG